MRKDSGIVYKENGAFKSVPRRSGGTTTIDSIVISVIKWPP